MVRTTARVCASSHYFRAERFIYYIYLICHTEARRASQLPGGETMQTIRAQETVQTIRAQDVEREEINEVERVLATLPNSELAHQLQHILRSVRRGFDLNVISQDGKLTPKTSG